MERAEAYRGMALGVTPPAKPTDAVFIHHRNRLALDGLDAADRDVVAVWGTSHLPGLTEGLHVRGYVPDIETWHTVGHLPSRLSYLGTLVGDLARNARRLPDMWREASQQAREYTTRQARR